MTTESEPLTMRTRLGPSDPKNPASAHAANSAGPTENDHYRLNQRTWAR